LVIALLVSVVIVAIGAGASFVRTVSAGVELVNAQAETQSLLAQQQQYSEATSTAFLVSGIEQARTATAATEVLWQSLVPAMSSALPEGVSFDSASFLSYPVWQGTMPTTGPLRPARSATVSMVIVSPSPFDATAIARDFEKFPSFADASPDVITRDNSLYKTTITLNVTDAAFSGRFQEETK
jgi:hypothetical protein